MHFFEHIFRKKIRALDLLQGMIDVHSHLLPGVDDGAPDRESAIEALVWLYRKGVKAIWLTPHVMDVFPHNTSSYLKKCMDDFHASCPENIPELRLAAEYMLDAGFLTHLNDGLLTLSGKKVLVETSYFSVPRDIDHLFHELFSGQYIPVVAHPERYRYPDKELLFQWKEMGCLFQLNLMSLAGIYGRREMKTAKRFLKEGVYDFLGSDIHRLNIYCRALERMNLSGKERKALERLLENNRALWIS
jgi:tyrosine-protein phosphatase YwqE